MFFILAVEQVPDRVLNTLFTLIPNQDEMVKIFAARAIVHSAEHNMGKLLNIFLVINLGDGDVEVAVFVR